MDMRGSVRLFDQLWDAYPKTGPTYCSWVTNQCAVKMSIALQRSGIYQFDAMTASEVRLTGTCGRLANRSDADGRDPVPFLATVAEGLARSLEADGFVFRASRKFRRNSEDGDAFWREVQRELANSTGIIFFKDYWRRSGQESLNPTGDHIDLWKRGVLKGTEVSPDSIVHRCREVWFWYMR